MSASVKIVGGDELMAALRALPEQLAHEAGGIVAGHAELMAAKVRATELQSQETLRAAFMRRRGGQRGE